jgi:hypothetical protein
MKNLLFSQRTVSTHFTSPGRALKESGGIGGKFPAIDIVTYDGANACTIDNRRATVHHIFKASTVPASDQLPVDQRSRFGFYVAIKTEIPENPSK